MIFYILVTVVSSIAFTVDMILRYMEKIRSFGMETRFHNIKGTLIPIEDFIPHNLTMAEVFFMSFGVLGIIMKSFGINSLVVFPCCVAFGCIVNFIVMHIIKPFIMDVSGVSLPEKSDISGHEAVCTDTIYKGDYGKIEYIYNGRKYEFDAVSANETDIEKGEKLFILYRQDGLCFVEKQTEVMNVINEDVEENKKIRDSRQRKM